MENTAAEFIKSLVLLTNGDKLIWDSHDFGQKEKVALAYISPWMICLQSDDNRLILQVAKSYHEWTEFSGREFDLGSLLYATAAQHSRWKRGLLVKTVIDEKKVKKFKLDKIRKDAREERQRLEIVSDCVRILSDLKKAAV